MDVVLGIKKIHCVFYGTLSNSRKAFFQGCKHSDFSTLLFTEVDLQSCHLKSIINCEMLNIHFNVYI